MKTTRTSHPLPGALKLYQERTVAIKKELSRIERALIAHAKMASKNPNHYGYPGDLGHVLEQLAEVLPAQIK